MTQTGLRQRKKRDTRRALTQAAHELVSDRGLEHVTVEDIAAAADVSERTFFNYFSCKEEAVVGVEPGVLAEMADELASRPDSEGPVEALRSLLLNDGPDQILRRWQRRNHLVGRYPALLPRYLAANIQVEEALAAALAKRSGIDPTTDPSLRLLVAAVLASLRAALAWWDTSDQDRPVADVIDTAFNFLAPTVRNP
jgi:AcrR family transcriptional regulator